VPMKTPSVPSDTLASNATSPLALIAFGQR
jgi:hypothetical protein